MERIIYEFINGITCDMNGGSPQKIGAYASLKKRAQGANVHTDLRISFDRHLSSNE